MNFTYNKVLLSKHTNCQSYGSNYTIHAYLKYIFESLNLNVAINDIVMFFF